MPPDWIAGRFNGMLQANSVCLKDAGEGEMQVLDSPTTSPPVTGMSKMSPQAAVEVHTFPDISLIFTVIKEYFKRSGLQT